ncbi:MAG: hypothetical protein HY735_36715 [Verrucomicrobia bacterium]|nr:hypothetical protein [Verrucomicrobiota bacterium]
MKNSWDSAVVVVMDEKDRARENKAKSEFQIRFKRALTQCVRRGFSVEECFGVIWEETLEIIDVSDETQSELYPQLIDWAKQWGH